MPILAQTYSIVYEVCGEPESVGEACAFFYKMLLQSCQNEKGNTAKQHFNTNTNAYETLLTRFFASIVPFARGILVLANAGSVLCWD